MEPKNFLGALEYVRYGKLLPITGVLARDMYVVVRFSLVPSSQPSLIVASAYTTVVLYQVTAGGHFNFWYEKLDSNKAPIKARAK